MRRTSRRRGGIHADTSARAQSASERAGVLGLLLADPERSYSLPDEIARGGAAGRALRSVARPEWARDSLRLELPTLGRLWDFLGGARFAAEYFERKPLLLACTTCGLGALWPLDGVKDGRYALDGPRVAPNMRFIRLLFTNKLALPAGLAPPPGGRLSRPQMEYALENGFTLQSFGTSLWNPDVAALCGGFGAALQRHCSANLYVTPPGVAMSLRPHNDYQCVFIVQVRPAVAPSPGSER
eukprot:SAG11_NODE_623_length_8115_cov_51.423278_2_plen_241_part_00